MRHWLFGCCLALPLGVACVGELDGNETDYKYQPDGGAIAAGGQSNTGGSSSRAGSGGGGAGDCDVEALFTRKGCDSDSCHGGNKPQAGLDLTASDLAAELVDVASNDSECASRLLVDPNNIDGSFLLEKLEEDRPECGEGMPIGVKLTAQEIACVREWVKELANGQ